MKKIIIPIICTFLLITTVYSATNTTAGVTLNFSTNTQTSQPNNLTLFIAKDLLTSYANRESDLSSNKVTYTGHISPQYSMQSYIEVRDKTNLSKIYCKSNIGTNAVCTINYLTYPSNTIVYFCNEKGGCSKGMLYPNQINSGEHVKNGIKLSFSSKEDTSSPNTNTLYDVGNQKNYLGRFTDNNANTLTYSGSLNSNYPFDSYFKIIDKTDPSNIHCQSSIANEDCVISYTTQAPSQSSTYYMFCNAFGGCSRGITTYYIGGEHSEIAGPGIVLTYTLTQDIQETSSNNNSNQANQDSPKYLFPLTNSIGYLLSLLLILIPLSKRKK
jgi:hypothetical protein